MSAAEERAGELRRLVLELRADLEAIADLAALAATVSSDVPVATEPARRDLMALALTLHHVYTATEQSLLRIVKAYDRSPYVGADWHRDLLRNMAIELPGVRPAVLTPELRRALDEYRGFRHVVRHGYDYELDWRRLKPLVDGLPGLTAAIERAFGAFLQFIEACVTSLEN